MGILQIQRTAGSTGRAAASPRGGQWRDWAESANLTVQLEGPKNPDILTSAAKTLKAIRSYEFAMKFPFDPDTDLRVLSDRMGQYADLFDKKAKAQKAALAKSKRK